MNRRTITMLAFLAAFTLCLYCPVPGNAESPRQETGIMEALPNFSPLIQKLTPVTVNISTEKTVTSGMPRFGTPFQGPGDPFRDFFGDDFLKRFFGDIPEREFKKKGLGSGFIIDEDGYVITNNHVVEGADEIKVKTHDQREYDAEIVGRDAKTDIALIKIKDLQNDLPAAKLGDSDALKVGEWVIAIGNPFGLQETVTTGIVSAKWRKIGRGPYEDFIQTDASINPGNSGGPLFNMHGEVVGVNTMIYSTTGGNIGIGFAIPINLAESIVQQLKERGKVIRGWLGVVVQTVTPELAETFGLDRGTGALVAEVADDGPAEDAGIRPGDIIVEYGDEKVEDMASLPLMVAETPVGKKVDVMVVRNGKKIEKTVRIGELEEERTRKSASYTKNDIGISVREITPGFAERYGLTEDEGVVITSVSAGSPAALAGLRKGDIIMEIDRRRIRDYDDYTEALDERKDDKVLFLVKRKDMSLWVVVTLEE